MVWKSIPEVAVILLNVLLVCLQVMNIIKKLQRLTIAGYQVGVPTIVVNYGFSFYLTHSLTPFNVNKNA